MCRDNSAEALLYHIVKDGQSSKGIEVVRNRQTGMELLVACAVSVQH